MRLDTSLQQRMDQRQTLDPRLIQAMEVLQLSAPALEQKVEAELMDNPALEIEPPEGENWQWDDRRRPGASGNNQTRRVRMGAGERDAKQDAMANAPAKGASLHDQLKSQWCMAEANEDDLKLGEFLLSRIDADGYLRESGAALISAAPPHTRPEDVERVIRLLQTHLEPPGLAARNLRECLLLQIAAEEKMEAGGHPLERAIVLHHLPDIEANHLPKVVAALGASMAQIQAAVKGLRRFNPHPGRLLASEAACNIYPDAAVEFDEMGAITVELARGNLPPLSINSAIETLTRDKGADPQMRKDMAHYVGKARTLMEAIEQRRATLQKVICEAVREQRAFFEQGPQALKPLTETEIAHRLGVHVATVSRAVSDKYLDTPRGILPLRMLFSGGTTNTAGEALAWGAVQEKLKRIVAGENPKKPLSDDALVKELEKSGLTIARRTVAKYRDELDIPTARERKKH